MEVQSQRPKGRDRVVSSLNVAIEAMNLAKEVSGITPAKAVFGSVGALLTMIRVSSLLIHGEMLQAHLLPGFDGQQTGSRRAWVGMR